MGERLAIRAKRGDEQLASLYYQWGAYTDASLDECRYIIEHFYNRKYLRIKDERLRLIKIIEDKGGCIANGLDSEEGRFIQKKYPNVKFNKTGNHSEGLIAISEQGMNELENWCIGIAEIDFDDKTISLFLSDAYHFVNEYDEKDFLKEWDCESMEVFENMETPIESPLPYSLESDIPFTEIYRISKFINETNYDWIWDDDSTLIRI